MSINQLLPVMNLVAEGKCGHPITARSGLGRLVGDAAGLARTRRGLVVIGLTALVALVAAGLGLGWWTHPDLFGSEGGDGGVTATPHPVDQAQLTFAVITAREPVSPTTITFRSTPVMDFATNTAGATATFGICHRSPGRRWFIENVDGRELRFCSRIEPIVAGTTFEYPSTTEYIIATSTPTKPGTVVISGADFTTSWMAPTGIGAALTT